MLHDRAAVRPAEEARADDQDDPPLEPGVAAGARVVEVAEQDVQGRRPVDELPGRTGAVAVAPLVPPRRELAEPDGGVGEVLPEGQRYRGLVDQAEIHGRLAGEGVGRGLAVDRVVADRLGDALAMLRRDLVEWDHLRGVDPPWAGGQEPATAREPGPDPEAEERGRQPSASDARGHEGSFRSRRGRHLGASSAPGHIRLLKHRPCRPVSSTGSTRDSATAARGLSSGRPGRAAKGRWAAGWCLSSGRDLGCGWPRPGPPRRPKPIPRKSRLSPALGPVSPAASGPPGAGARTEANST